MSEVGLFTLFCGRGGKGSIWLSSFLLLHNYLAQHNLICYSHFLIKSHHPSASVIKVLKPLVVVDEISKTSTSMLKSYTTKCRGGRAQ